MVFSFVPSLPVLLSGPAASHYHACPAVPRGCGLVACDFPLKPTACCYRNSDLALGIMSSVLRKLTLSPGWRLLCRCVTVPPPALLYLILSVSLFTYHLVHAAPFLFSSGRGLCRLGGNELSRPFSATQKKEAPLLRALREPTYTGFKCIRGPPF